MSVQQDLIPYAGQLEIVNVPIEGWIIYPDVHGLLYDSCGVVCLPTCHGEVFHTDMLTKSVQKWNRSLLGTSVELYVLVIEVDVM